MKTSQEHVLSVWALISLGILGFVGAFAATLWGALDASAYAWISLVATAMVFGGLTLASTGYKLPRQVWRGSEMQPKSMSIQ